MYFAIKFDNGTYFYGLNQYGPEIRKAKLYISENWAKNSGDGMLKRHPLSSYQIVKIEIKEV